VRGIDTIVIAGGRPMSHRQHRVRARDLDYGIVVVRDACIRRVDPNHDFSWIEYSRAWRA